MTHHDSWGNVNFTQDYDGHDTYYAYAGTKGQYQFGNGKTGLIQMFYTNSTIDSHIHTDLLGTGTFQNPSVPNSAIETFYLYDNNEVLREAQLYISPSGLANWLIDLVHLRRAREPADGDGPPAPRDLLLVLARVQRGVRHLRDLVGDGELQRRAQRDASPSPTTSPPGRWPRRPTPRGTRPPTPTTLWDG